jgi:hypothetical protein
MRIRKFCSAAFFVAAVASVGIVAAPTAAAKTSLPDCTASSAQDCALPGNVEVDLGPPAASPDVSYPYNDTVGYPYPSGAHH